MALIKVNNRGQSSDFSTEIGATKNLIINGAMQVSQRGTDINDIANDSTYIMDRFLTRDYGGDGTYDYDYSTDVPTATFKNSLKLTCKSASTNTGTYGYSIEQRIEGYNIRQLRLGRSNAQPITVSFWVKSSVAGTYSTGLRTTSGEYSYVTEFALSANTWKYVTYTAPALTNSLSSLNEESGGSGLLVDLVGLGKQTSKETSTLNAWQSGNKVNSSNQVAWMDSVNATVHLTGVQLEVGEIATPFEHRSFGEEFELCQRYYSKASQYGSAWNAGQKQQGSFASHGSSNGWFGPIEFPVTMRIAPTMQQTGTQSYNGSTWTSWSSVSMGARTENSCYADCSGGVSTSNGQSMLYQMYWEANAEL